MLLKRLYDEKLAQASYLVGSTSTGDALVVDPNRDAGQYLAAAKAEGMRITHVTETHIHADFVSGARELAERAGAKLLLSGAGPAEWQYGFTGAHGFELLGDGSVITIGDVRLDVRHTPGHTPEHLIFLVTDLTAADRPLGAFTGDLVFVGAVGRPDLLERAANVQGTMVAMARQLFQSLRRFDVHPDYLQLWPGHGAGSACGKALGAVPQTTLGYERIVNPGFTIQGEQEFVEWVLAGQPDPPTYFAIMKRVNKEGPRLIGPFREPPRLGDGQLALLLDAGAFVLDTRGTLAYAAGHIPGTINIPLSKSFNTWAGWLVPYDRDIYVVVDEGRPGALNEVVRDLAMVGLDRIAGYFGTDALNRWRAESREVGTVASITVGELADQWQAGRVQVVDVRAASEFEAGHVPGARSIPLGMLTARADELPLDQPIVLHCESGSRSAIAASLLQARGMTNVRNYRGGFAEWTREGRPIERAPVADAAHHL